MTAIARMKNPEDLPTRLRSLCDGLLVGLVEREEAVRLALLAALTGEHALLIGPPGTAKSLVARRLHLAFVDAPYFERLLTRFTVPEELFGPLSIKGLEEDRYERLTDAYLPKAGIAFLDEIFKANSAILNALLTLLNEREFDNGARREPSPLVAAVGASNELPEGDELDALFDRFLVRLHVGPVSKDAFASLLNLRGDAAPEIPPALRMTNTDLETLRERVRLVDVPDDVVALLSELRGWCAAETIPVSDRRWRKIVRLLQTAAYTNGRDAVSIWDCWLLQHCLWARPEQRAAIHGWYATRVGASAAMDPSRLTRMVVAWEARLERDRTGMSQARDAEGHVLFVGDDGKPTRDRLGATQAKRGKEPLFLAPPNAKVHRGYGHRAPPPGGDRTNEGKGYTQTELNQLWVHEPQSGDEEFIHWSGRDAYLANRANWLTTKSELAPSMEPTRHKAPYVEDCLREIRTQREVVEVYGQKLAAHIESLHDDIRANLWVSDDFVEPAARSLEETRRTITTLISRIDALAKGFARLPREEPLDVDVGPS